ncbi:MAG: MFS transporter [Halocynthiibacter sp.]
MFQVVGSAWALLFGMMLLMVGNGLQGTLLGVRGELEGFSTFEMSVIMAGYFAGFLGGSHAAPELIRRVGHVRVFAALASFISAVLVLYPVITHPVAWTIGRVIIGFCFSGVYVTAESWLNNATDNDNRGKALSAYLIVQMIGIVAAQGILVLADPNGYILFVITSVLVSISFAPILLSITPTPSFETTAPMSLRTLARKSPLGFVGSAILGGIFSAQFGMAAIFATQAGLSVGQLSIFVSSIYVGALFLQYPVGWISDRMDRRLLIGILAAVGGTAAIFVAFSYTNFYGLLAGAFIIGGTSNPLYALIIAHTNDFLENDEMAAASGGLVFVNGLGAILGPVVVGYMMGVIGPGGFFIFMAVLFGLMAAYAGYRMTQRAGPSIEDTGSYTPISPAATQVAVEVAQEVFIEALEDGADDES